MGIKDSFENKLINGVHASRYIASWYNMGGGKVLPGKNGWKEAKIVEWLFRIGVNEDDAHRIYLLATNGRLELETSVKKFLEEDQYWVKLEPMTNEEFESLKKSLKKLEERMAERLKKN